MKKIILAFAIFINSAFADCKANPDILAEGLAEICYECMLPISFAGHKLSSGTLPDTIDKSTSTFCTCPKTPIEQVGIPLGYYFPDKVVDSNKDAWCFQGLGIDLSKIKGIYGDGMDKSQANSNKTTETYFAHSHLFAYPVTAALKSIFDSLCLTADLTNFIELLTEVDPTWNDDMLAILFAPDAILHSNPISAISCAADSLMAQANRPIDLLYWCKGAWGEVFPLSGQVDRQSDVEDAAGVASNMIFKATRMGAIWKSYGKSAMCAQHPTLIWGKSAFRLQLFSPVQHPIATGIGMDGLLFETGKTLPAQNNYSFFLFRKFECCFL